MTLPKCIIVIAVVTGTAVGKNAIATHIGVIPIVITVATTVVTVITVPIIGGRSFI